MKQTTAILTLFIVTIIFSAGCGRKASEEIDFGTVIDSTYYNNYFGFNIDLPKEWNVQDNEAREKLMKLGGKIAAGNDKNLAAAVQASDMTTVSLFAAFKHAIGTPVSYNPNIMSLAERVRDSPGIKEGRDYLFHAKRVMESSQLQFNFPKEISIETLGGKEFAVMHTEMPVAGMIVRQKYYAVTMKGYALGFIVSFTTDEEEALLDDILKTVKFK